VGGSAKSVNLDNGNGGDGGNAFIAKASIGGDTSSGNYAAVSQSTHQNIVVVPVAVQEASARYNGLSHAIQ
jgi:hypothetical protein